MAQTDDAYFTQSGSPLCFELKGALTSDFIATISLAPSLYDASSQVVSLYTGVTETTVADEYTKFSVTPQTTSASGEVLPSAQAWYITNEGKLTTTAPSNGGSGGAPNYTITTSVTSGQSYGTVTAAKTQAEEGDGEKFTFTIYNHYVPGSEPITNGKLEYAGYLIKGPLSAQSQATGLQKVIIVEDIYPTSLQFNGCTQLESIEGLDKLHTDNVTNMNGMFDGCYSLEGGAGTEYNSSNANDATYAHIDSTANPGYFTGDGTSGSTATFMVNSTGDNTNFSTGLWHAGGPILGAYSTYQLTGFSRSADAPDTSNSELVINVSKNAGDAPIYVWENDSGEIKWYSEAETVYLEEDVSGMFNLGVENDSAATTTIDLSGLDMSKVSNTKEMFRYQSALTSITWGSGDNISITNAEYMFYECMALETVDLSPFTFASATSVIDMFSYCYELTTIYADSGVVFASSLSSQQMFANLQYGTSSNISGGKLTGGNETAWDSEHVTAEYARIDATGTPGYFTRKPSAP
ncbi:MAG: BspA family leucine-rich repeat surface protein [Treponema sp.]|nr:BspA family leucine-rich repeat surface protein [Treponema sp.]